MATVQPVWHDRIMQLVKYASFLSDKENEVLQIIVDDPAPRLMQTWETVFICGIGKRLKDEGIIK